MTDSKSPAAGVLAALNGTQFGKVPSTRETFRCSGASLIIDYDAYRALERQGVKWATRSDDIPRDGAKVTARVACSREALTKRNAYGDVVSYALCATCAGFELNQRKQKLDAQRADHGDAGRPARVADAARRAPLDAPRGMGDVLGRQKR